MCIKVKTILYMLYRVVDESGHEEITNAKTSKEVYLGKGIQGK